MLSQLSHSTSQRQRPLVWSFGRDTEVPSDDSDSGVRKRRERSRRPKRPTWTNTVLVKDRVFGSQARKTASLHTIAPVTQPISQCQCHIASYNIMQRTNSSNVNNAASSFSGHGEDVILPLASEHEPIIMHPPREPALIEATGLNAGDHSNLPLHEYDPESLPFNALAIEACMTNSKSWIFFSMWNPALRYLSESSSASLSGEIADFKKVMIEDIERSFIFPRGVKERSIRVMRVREVVGGTDGREMELCGTWCTFGRTSDSQQLTRGSMAGVLKIGSSDVQYLLLRLVKRNDIIINFSSTSPEIGNTGSCVIHVSLNNKKLEAPALFLGLPDSVQMDVSHSKSVDSCGSFTVCKFAPIVNDLMFEEEEVAQGQACAFPQRTVQKVVSVSPQKRRLQKEVPAEVVETKHNKHEQNFVPPPNKRTKNLMPSTSQIRAGPSAPSRHEARKEGDQTTNGHKKSFANEVDIEIDVANYPDNYFEFEHHEVVADVCMQQNPSTGAPQKAQIVDKDQGQFDLQEFLSKGQFVPGPLQPKLKPPDLNCFGEKEECQYPMLAQFESIFYDEVDQMLETSCVPMNLTARFLHVVVVKLISDDRHANTYTVRVSDETKSAVLLRLHNQIDGSEVGPRIQVGDIIRVHEVTARREWDPDIRKNVMVLSTCSHSNYVIFRLCPETRDRFFYDSCAPCIVFDECIDRIRVAKLQKFFLSTSVQPVVQDEKMEHEGMHRTSTPVLRNQNLSFVFPDVNEDFSDLQSDGICSSDIVSPACSAELFGDQCMIEVEEIPLRNGCHSQNGRNSLVNSEDSFVTAPNVDAMGNNVNAEAEVPPVEASPELLRVHSFRDLKNTNATLNMVIKLISFGLDGNMCYIGVKDFESSEIPEDFKRSYPSAKRGRFGENELVMDVTNVDKFLARGMFDDEFFEWIGSDSIYIAEGIRVKGDAPPYRLELDGEFSQIRESKPEDLNFLGLEITFSSASSINNNRH